jgi:hypothetical protein
LHSSFYTEPVTEISRTIFYGNLPKGSLQKPFWYLSISTSCSLQNCLGSLAGTIFFRQKNRNPALTPSEYPNISCCLVVGTLFFMVFGPHTLFRSPRIPDALRRSCGSGILSCEARERSSWMVYFMASPIYK